MAPNKPPGNKKNAGTLLQDAETLLTVGDLDEAVSLALEALELTGEGGDFELRALNLLGTLHVEAGEVDDARSYFERAVKLDPEGSVDEKVGGGAEKFMLLAQLSEEGGQDSVRWFERGAASLRKQIEALTGLSRRTPEQEISLDEKQQKLGEVLCAVVEVYMTDLSWEEDAEQRCETLITEATMIAPKAAETWQTLANVRISQERIDEAKEALKTSLDLWQDLPPEHPSVPEFPTRISLARLLMETGMEDDALKVVDRLVADDDQSVEAWYLGGWCLYITGEKMKEADNKAEGKSSWSASRRWLSQCLGLYEILEYEDERLGQHANELMDNINKELGPPPENDEDESGDEDEDEDEEMKG